MEVYVKILKKVCLEHQDILKDFIIFSIEKDKRFKTIENYLIDLRQFFKYLDFKEKEINTLTSSDIESYKKYLFREGLKAKSINRKLTSINQLFKSININYGVKCKRMKEQKQTFLDDVLTRDEIEKMLKKCGTNIRDKAIIMTLYKTGLRVSELLQLRIRDIRKKSIEIEGKGGKYRYIIVPKELKEIWLQYLKVRKPVETDKLFVGTNGEMHRHNINRIIKKYAVQARITKGKAHPHALRHSFCKALAIQNVGIEVIADLAGHEDLNTTRIYTRQTQKELREKIELI
ncbi:integrase [Clostridium botulinum]|nr:integrase [Clostridium botulinum]